MMFLTITSRISNSFLACFGKQQKPFEELSLSQEAVRNIAEEIFDKGYASIPWSEATKAFFRDYQKNETGFDVTRCHKTGGSCVSYHFAETTVKEPEFTTFTQRTRYSQDIERANTIVSNFAKDLLAELFAMAFLVKNDEIPEKEFVEKIRAGVTPHESEIRECEDVLAGNWHKDEQVKLLTILSTIKGEETDFVSPKNYDDKQLTKQIESTQYLELNKLPRGKLPKENFNVLLTMYFVTSLNKFKEKFPEAKIENPPILVHRAPGTTKRVIGLWRYKVVTPKSPVTAIMQIINGLKKPE